MKISTIVLTVLLTVSFNQNISTHCHMSIFEKLFGKNQLAKKQDQKTNNQEIEKTSEMLDEQLFWSIVEKSLENTNNQDDQERFLVKEIEKLTPKQMIGFRLRTDKLLYDTYNSEMWCAGYIMNGGCSDDGFEYFRNWVISRGKETFYSAKDNPDSLISEFVEGNDFYEFEGFWYVALTAFKNKTGKELYDYISDDFKTNEGNYPNFEFTWKEEEPESMKAICPNLFEKMWN
tara:strand:- start:175 stop:870 length:696 start_codon:yes stop_codon:yes gene_type:complete